MHTVKYLCAIILIISTFKTLLGKRKRMKREQSCVYRHYIEIVLSFCFIYLFVYWLAFFNGFNLHILPSVWVITAESSQNLIQLSSPWQTSAYAANSHSPFLYLILSLPWTSTLSLSLHFTIDSFIHLHLRKISLDIHNLATVYYVRQTILVITTVAVSVSPAALYMHEAVANTVCCWLQRDFINPCGLISIHNQHYTSVTPLLFWNVTWYIWYIIELV